MRRLFTTLFCFVLALCAKGDNISEEQALDIAATFFNSTSNASNAKGEATPLTIAKRSTGYYAVNRGDSDGYVIVAATDCLGSDVLGYADCGHIDTLNLPDGLSWLLSAYDNQTAYAADHSINATSRAASRTAIEPMLTCLWDQESPYNDKCPDYNGQTCYVGCVATALAQIMYYHKWPKQGTGSVSYDWYVNNKKYKTLAADFSQSTYNWDSMSDTYNSASATESENAVAQLMVDVGMASNMQYSTDGSGAYTYDAATALVNNFGYDKGLRYVQRDFYTHDEWEDMLYGELAASRPLLYAGSDSENTGHAFVLDGYKDGYYHVNWGWSGLCNGYFLFSDLTPSIQGAGGSGTGYSYYAEALIGLQPAIDGSTEQPVIINYTNTFATATTTATRSSNVRFAAGIISYSLTTRSLTFGLKVVDSDSGATTYVKGTQTNTLSPYMSQDKNNIVYGYQVNMNGFPTANGTYRVYPACYDNALGEWLDVRSSTTSSSLSYIVATVSGNSIRFSMASSKTDATLAATDVTLSTKLYAGQTFNGTAIYTATGGDYYGDVKIGFAKSATTSRFTTYGDNTTLIDISEGTPQQLPFTSTAPRTAGTYYMAIIDGNGNAISDKIEVTVSSTPSGSLTLTAEGISMASTTDVDPLNIEFNFKVKCTSGFFSGCFYAYFFEDNAEYSYNYLASENVVIAKDDETTATFKGSVPQLLYNTHYTVYITCNGSFVVPQNLSSISLTTASSAGIEGISADGDSKDIAIYALNGTLVAKQTGVTADLSALSKGIYIVKAGGKTKKVIND